MSGEAPGELGDGEIDSVVPQSAGPEADSVAAEGPPAAPDLPHTAARDLPGPYVVPPFRPGPPPEPTGDARVDAALAPLGELGGTQVADHVEIFEGVHQRLQELLVSADEEEPGPPVPQPPGAGIAPPGGFGR
ncbi:hypothetical protein [Actinomadura rudentiformis]|uniref:Uncharacterized protein n=1 Tax=Actinomadura rudentiformis TaxID=359158 RepID=A0A6H9Y7K3_9ACTN|nr:hypothetical protein [Actinomadura rudentiformis]KAB2339944.1 hypothetical protein F8566_46145 [Actinomadura rudentiformis]